MAASFDFWAWLSRTCYPLHTRTCIPCSWKFCQKNKLQYLQFISWASAASGVNNYLCTGDRNAQKSQWQTNVKFNCWKITSPLVIHLKTKNKGKATRHHQHESKYHNHYGGKQCFFFSRNIGGHTPKIIYVYYLKKYFLDESIQKNNNLVLKTEALAVRFSS